MTLDTRLRPPNGAHLAPLFTPAIEDRPRDEISIRALCQTIDRLTALVERLIERDTAPAEPAAPAPGSSLARVFALTQRELDVARLIVEGLSSKEIRRRLVLSESTVNSHRRSIIRKVGSSSKAGLAANRAQWEVPE